MACQTFPSHEAQKQARLQDPPEWFYSYPKTGRTWIRYMLAHALCAAYGVAFPDGGLPAAYNVIPADDTGALAYATKKAYNFNQAGIPKIGVSHSAYAPDLHGGVSNPLLLIRDPRDTIVSHWMHLSKQHQYTGDLPSFIRHPDLGVAGYVAYYAGWAPHLQAAPVTYEAMRKDPHAGMHQVLQHLRIEADDAVVDHAVIMGDFKNMRRQELAHGVPLPYQNTNDPNALRVRQGKVGGFEQHMTTADLSYIHDTITAADVRTQELIHLTGYAALG